LHHGATVTIHSRFTPDAPLTTIERDRPTLTVLVPRDDPGPYPIIRLDSGRLSSLKRLPRARRSCATLIDRVVARGIPVLQSLWLDRNLPDRVYTRLGGDLSREGSTVSLAWLRSAIIDDAGNELPRRRRERSRCAAPTCSTNIGQ